MDIKRINISEVKPGMVLASDVYNTSEQLVLEKGTVLSDKNITRLKFYSVREADILLNAPLAVPKEPESMKQENVESYTKRLKKTPEYKNFARSYKNTAKTNCWSCMPIRHIRPLRMAWGMCGGRVNSIGPRQQRIRCFIVSA